jgi:DNA polymerase (family 10)
MALVRSRGLGSETELSTITEDTETQRHREDNPSLGHATQDHADTAPLKRLRQIYEAGGWVLVESTIADLPADLRWLYESGAVTLEELAAVHRTRNITSAADLGIALDEHALGAASGLDASVEGKIAAALPGLRAAIPRIPLGRAVAAAEPLLARLRSTAGVLWAEPAGSLRRGQDSVGDIELVASTRDPAAAIEHVIQDPEVVRCLHRSERRVYLRLDRLQAGLRLPEPAIAGLELLLLTGSRHHVEALRALAATKGLSLTSRGLETSAGTPCPTAVEDDIYTALGLPCIAPEIRDGDEAVRAAIAGGLPALVSRREILGDLHMHSTWSDGRDPIEAMVETCARLGYQYMAITDHSPSSAASRNLSADDVERQAEEIARLRQGHPDIAILHGCEVDILEGGRLDFPDRVLERFDIVLASLHERLGNGPDQLMKRYLSAMKHPLVTMITHPTNRIVPHRPGYILDYDRLFDAARETKTAVEIDGSPSHLDLDGALARKAVADGAIVAIDSDCHRADRLERQMHLGIVTARRGWVEPRHVLNTRPLDEVRAFIAGKRTGR